jgi:hypothetical protein
MSEYLNASEVLNLIMRELRQAQLGEIDPKHELFRSVRDAMTDQPQDIHAQAACALSALVAYGLAADQSNLDETLAELNGNVDGLGDVVDVHYVGEDLGALREFSLREHLPVHLEGKLTPDELGEVAAFIENAPGGAPDSTPPRTPPRAPRR